MTIQNFRWDFNDLLIHIFDIFWFWANVIQIPSFFIQISKRTILFFSVKKFSQVWFFVHSEQDVFSIFHLFISINWSISEVHFVFYNVFFNFRQVWTVLLDLLWMTIPLYYKATTLVFGTHLCVWFSFSYSWTDEYNNLHDDTINVQ